MKREIKFRIWLSGINKMSYPVDFDELVSWGKTPESAHLLQFTGLKDKNGKEIYEGDVIKWYTIETEYQTHYGDNIPNGAYTEPIGVTAIIMTMPVLYYHCGFTVYKPEDRDEDHFQCPIAYGFGYNKEHVKSICYPGNYFDKVSEEEFGEYVSEVCKDLKLDFSTIDQFVLDLNGFEIIGNIYENPELTQDGGIK